MNIAVVSGGEWHEAWLTVYVVPEGRDFNSDVAEHAKATRNRWKPDAQRLTAWLEALGYREATKDEVPEAYGD